MKKILGLTLAVATLFVMIPVLASDGGKTPLNRSNDDMKAPFVELTRLDDGDTVSGFVQVYGTVIDSHPDHYWAIVSDEDGNIVAGPGRVNANRSFTDDLLFYWYVETVPEGEYTISLSARDDYGNKDSGSVDQVRVQVLHE